MRFLHIEKRQKREASALNSFVVFVKNIKATFLLKSSYTHSNPRGKDNACVCASDTERYPRQIYPPPSAFYHRQRAPFRQEAPMLARREAPLKIRFRDLRRRQARQSQREGISALSLPKESSGHRAYYPQARIQRA